jgi:hypothetical protein
MWTPSVIMGKQVFFTPSLCGVSMSNQNIKVTVQTLEDEYADLPAKNVHAEDLLKRVAQAAKNHEPKRLVDLCELGVDLQKSLRAANCDSPRINADPAFRWVMVQVGALCNLNNFDAYSHANAEMQSHVGQKTPQGQRAGWADMAQGGAVNLTPMMTSLHKASIQVVAEGGVPEKDGSVFLIAHQMAHIAQTMSVAPDSHACGQLASWCDAQRALQAVDAIEEAGAKKTASP